MAQVYGRLDVFFSDGLLKTFQLSEPNLSVGRSPGNAIPLETETISRYHLSITRQGRETFVTDLDSQNGTFVGGTRLPKNTPRQISGGEEILIGELRLIFQEFDESPTRPMLVPEETMHAERVEAHLKAELQGPEIAVPPGAHTSACLKLINTGSVRERYLIDLEGVPKAWTRIDRSQVEIEPGASADITINFKPARRSDTTPREYPINLVVTPKSEPEQTLRLALALRVLAYGGIGIALEKRQLNLDGQFRVHLHNQGSAPLPLSLTALSRDDTVVVTLQPPQITLAPGQRAVVSGQARPKRSRLIGDASVEQFEIVARSQTPSHYQIALGAYLPVRPALPRWAAFAGGGVGVALLALILFGLLVLLQPAPPPTIRAFSVQVVPNNPAGSVIATWQIDDGDTLSLLNGETVLAQRIPVEVGSTLLQLAPGSYTLTLRAYRGSAFADASAPVTIAARASAAVITLSPPVPIQYVVQTVTLNWQAENVARVQIEGITDFSSTPLESEYPAQGSLQLAIVPTRDTYTLMLVLTDAGGTITRQAFSFNTVDPSCQARANTPLREGPFTSAQVISTIGETAAVLVDAQDISAGWLRVQGRGWGEIAAFTCTGFNPGDLLKELNVATPPPLTPLGLTLTPATGSPATLVPATGAPLIAATTVPAGTAAPAAPAFSTITPSATLRAPANTAVPTTAVATTISKLISLSSTPNPPVNAIAAALIAVLTPLPAAAP